MGCMLWGFEENCPRYIGTELYYGQFLCTFSGQVWMVPDSGKTSHLAPREPETLHLQRHLPFGQAILLWLAMINKKRDLRNETWFVKHQKVTNVMFINQQYTPQNMKSYVCPCEHHVRRVLGRPFFVSMQYAHAYLYSLKFLDWNVICITSQSFTSEVEKNEND